MASKTKKSKKTEAKINNKVLIPMIVVCIVIAIIIACASLGGGKREVPELYTFDKDIAQGVDISEHNGKVNWKALSKDYDFAFIRVGYRGYSEPGNIFEDKTARTNLSEANKAGIPVGIYFYSQAINTDEAEREAAYAVKIARKYDISLPIIIDFEYPCDSNGKHVGRLSQSNLSARDNTDIINAFIDEVHSRGYNAGVYASSSVLFNRINMKHLDRDALVWVADYNSRVTYNVDYTVWQYSEKGKSKAVASKYVDLNYWYKP